MPRQIKTGDRVNTSFEPPVCLGSKKEEMSVTVLVSNEKVNRMGMVVLNSAFGKMSNFKKQPVLLDNHPSRTGGGLEKVLGGWKNLRVTADGLIGTAVYKENHPPAQHAYELCEMGLGAFSIGFKVLDVLLGEDMIKKSKDVPAKVKKAKPMAVMTSLELMEISQCCVPQNPDAVNDFLVNSEDREGAERLVRLAVETGFYSSEPEIIPPVINTRKRVVTGQYLQQIMLRNELEMLLADVNT